MTRAVALAGVALLLAGCTFAGTDSATEPSPSSVASAHPVSSSTPEQSESPAIEIGRDLDSPLTRNRLLAALPEETLALTPEAALAFAAFFMDLEYEMYAPPYDTTLYGTLSSTECQYCGAALSSVADWETLERSVEKEPCRSDSSDGYLLEETDYLWVMYQVCDSGLSTITRSENHTELATYAEYCLVTKVIWTNSHWMTVESTLHDVRECTPSESSPAKPINKN